MASEAKWNYKRPMADSESHPSDHGKPTHGAAQSAKAGGPPALPEIDLRERGAGGETLERRVFFQLLVFQSPEGHPASAYVGRLGDALAEVGSAGVVYADVNDPRGLGLVTFSEDPGHFVNTIRPLFEWELLRDLSLRPEFTMLGRTYSTGHEQNLPFWVLERPVQNVLDTETPWHVWYPLRRSGAFEQLEGREKGKILMEHAMIGRAYGAAGAATDIRLACHGLDANDNEFIIGLIGKELYPLSHVVQSMRKTKQTSQYISQMGPFFVGKVVRQLTGN